MSRLPAKPTREPLAEPLVVRRRIHGIREKVFAAWTRPERLIHWWGSQGVSCAGADIDWRVGGSFRIANQYPDGSITWKQGTLELIDVPFQLAYSWELESKSKRSELVTVQFAERDGSTEVVVIHERIADKETRTRHEHEWVDCLDALVRYVAPIRSLDHGARQDGKFKTR